MAERAQNADFCRKPQAFADSPLLLEILAFGGRRKPQKTVENRRKPRLGVRHLRSGTFSSALYVCVCVCAFSSVVFFFRSHGCSFAVSAPLQQTSRAFRGSEKSPSERTISHPKDPGPFKLLGPGWGGPKQEVRNCLK